MEGSGRGRALPSTAFYTRPGRRSTEGGRPLIGGRLVRGRSDGRVQRLLKKSLGSVTFRQHFAHFSLRWHEADFVGERAYGDLPFQEDENCYKDSGKPLRPRMWRTGRPVLHRRLVVDVVAGGVQGFCAPGPARRWAVVGDGPQVLRKPLTLTSGLIRAFSPVTSVSLVEGFHSSIPRKRATQMS